MSALIINSEGKKNLKLLADLANELGYKVSIISDEEFEDMALGSMMKKEKTGKAVSRDTIMKKLRS